MDGIETEDQEVIVIQSTMQVLAELKDKQEQAHLEDIAILLKDEQAAQVEEKTTIICHLIQLFIYGKELNRKECLK